MKFKRFLLPILTLAVIVTAMAFTLPGRSNSDTTKATNVRLSYYFQYIGPAYPTSFSVYTNPANYVLVPDGQDPNELCEPGEDAVCFISCEGAYYLGYFRPDFSNTTWGTAYWGLWNFFVSHVPLTGAVVLKDLP